MIGRGRLIGLGFRCLGTRASIGDLVAWSWGFALLWYLAWLLPGGCVHCGGWGWGAGVSLAVLKDQLHLQKGSMATHLRRYRTTPIVK